jgi:hypothetical protein
MASPSTNSEAIAAPTDEMSTLSVAETIAPTVTQQLPANWPENIIYITDPTYSPNVPAEMRDGLSRKNAESESLQRIPASLLQYPCPRVSIKIIEKLEHPARGQRGLFAAEQLPPDSLIIVYTGHIHMNSMSDTDPHSDYDLSLDKDLGLSIDAGVCGNEARTANDFRGIAERPNAEFRDCFIKVPSDRRAGGTKWERRVGIFVLSAGNAGKRKAGIRKDEEILVSYGKGFWEARRTIATYRRDAEMLKMANAALDA